LEKGTGWPDEWEKKSPFCRHEYITCLVEKSSPRICAASVIFTNLSKESNRTICENSPNLVTLIGKLRTASHWRPPRLRYHLSNRSSIQGCQIFLGTKYQNGKKYTK
jgi:hypothetical protein